MRPRDTQKSRVYRAENSCSWARFEQTIPNHELQTWAEENILGKAWFRKRFGNVHVTIELGRNGGVAYSGLFTNNRITLGVPFRNAWGMCHEIAHIITPADGHGKHYARNYLFLVEKVMGKEQADELKAQFKANRVKMVPATAMPQPTKRISEMPKRPAVAAKAKPKRPRQWTVRDVERKAKDLGATIHHTARKGGRWFDLEVTAPEGKVWAVDYDGETVESINGGSTLATYGFEWSAFTKSERISEMLDMMEAGLQEPDKAATLDTVGR